MCDSDHDTDFTFRSWRTARKPHACMACREGIKPGDLYHLTTQGERGERPSSYRHCARCYAICEALWAAGASYVDYALSCGEKWEENFGVLPTAVAELAFLTPAEAQTRARAQVRT